MILAQLEQHAQTPGTEGGRRPTGVPGVELIDQDVEVVAKKTRRRLSVGYKNRVLKTIGELQETEGKSVGSYLRKEGLYYSTVRRWMDQRDHGKLTATKSGRKTKKPSTLQAENQRLRHQLEKTEKRLKKTELIVELQKKISMILGIDQPEIVEKRLGRSSQ